MGALQWETETEWHRSWKAKFHTNWQEQIHKASDGEKHIADVKTDKDWILEFQYSVISSEERQARTSFYKKLVWVVNGLRRKNDQPKFFEALREVKSLTNNPLIRRICIVNNCKSTLIKEWGSYTAPIFFDFGEEHVLWGLIPANTTGRRYVMEFSRIGFIELHRNSPPQQDLFAELLDNFIQQIYKYDLQLKIP